MSSGDGKDPERAGELGGEADEPTDSTARRPTPAPRGRGLGLRASHPVLRRGEDESKATPSTPSEPPTPSEPSTPAEVPSTPAEVPSTPSELSMPSDLSSMPSELSTPSEPSMPSVASTSSEPPDPTAEVPPVAHEPAAAEVPSAIEAAAVEATAVEAAAVDAAAAGAPVGGDEAREPTTDRSGEAPRDDAPPTVREAADPAWVEHPGPAPWSDAPSAAPAASSASEPAPAARVPPAPPEPPAPLASDAPPAPPDEPLTSDVPPVAAPPASEGPPDEPLASEALPVAPEDAPSLPWDAPPPSMEPPPAPLDEVPPAPPEEAPSLRALAPPEPPAAPPPDAPSAAVAEVEPERASADPPAVDAPPGPPDPGAVSTSIPPVSAHPTGAKAVGAVVTTAPPVRLVPPIPPVARPAAAPEPEPPPREPPAPEPTPATPIPPVRTPTPSIATPNPPPRLQETPVAAPIAEGLAPALTPTADAPGPTLEPASNGSGDVEATRTAPPRGSRGVRGLVLASLGFGGFGALAIGAVLLVAIGLILWFTLHSRVMFALWDRTAAQELSAAERGQLAACESPGWGGWIRAVTADIELACGEDWAVTAFAERIGSPDRAAWLAQRFPASPPGAQMRIATALAVAGYAPPREPAWLVSDLPDARRAMWTLAAFRSDVVGLHTGPSVAAAAQIARAEAGQVDPGAALPILEWFAAVDDPAAEAEAVRVAASLAEAYPEAVEQLRQQHLTGRSLTLPVPSARWTRTMQAHPECPPRCAALWTEILGARLSDEAIDLGVAPADGPAEPPPVAELTTALGASAAERRGVAFAVKAAGDWVAAGPDPASRLRSLAARPARRTSSVARVPWDGAGLPFTSAVVLQAVGAAAGVDVEVRVGAENQVWLRIGGVDVARTCGAPGAPPEGPAWPAPAILAAAIGEQAARRAEDGDAVGALRLASAAERLDPLIGGSLVVKLAQQVPPELSAGRRVGLALLRPSAPLTEAEPSRRRAGEQALLRCPAEALAAPPPPPAPPADEAP